MVVIMFRELLIVVFLSCTTLRFGQCQHNLDDLVQVEDGLYSKDPKESDTVLRCGLSENITEEVTFTWTKDGELIAMDNPHIVITTHRHPDYSILNITIVGQSELGNYKCNVTLSNGQTISKTVTFYALPQVKMPKSVNLVEGNDLELTCYPWGWPIPKVSWQRTTDEQLNLSDPRVSFKNDSETGAANTTLVIREMRLDERANYYCIATTFVNGSHYEANVTTLVRVKDNLAPLWPFLGILAEIIVLAVIITVYECRRKKEREADERKNNAENETLSSSQDNRNADVRRRK
jgi:hypothetical protein